ncbi:tumor necrosis factor receptor superfamily member 10A-like isoform X2 [Petaurus breviceps papuanus]|uniref:tumor necrosis factor receptor superfamily member 10A-like isoform X2 n=1 Tax=Petaurus breviceps papuanus TaxID=3040969 RepID=UPI0036DD3AFC
MYFVSFQVMRKLLSALLPNQEDRVLDSACDSKTEYWHDGRCCLYCWAGTRVLQHCTLPHTLGSCEKCPLGEFALKNGLETCMQCAQCREDQVKVGPCIGGINTKCQCKEGYYCENPDCEICQRCTERCPEGMEIFQGCNATADTHCGVSGIGGPQEGMGMLASWVPILILIFILILILGVCWLCIYCKKKRKCSLGTDTGRSPDESLETVLIKKSNGPVSTVPDSRSQSLEVEFDKVYALKDDTEPGRNRSFYIFQHHIHENWNEFVRNLGLEENEIATAVQKHPHNPEEQKFQMLLTWWNKTGRAASAFQLLAAAHKVPTISTRVQNILNELINEGILCKRQEA